jgi:hypothetical protein
MTRLVPLAEPQVAATGTPVWRKAGLGEDGMAWSSTVASVMDRARAIYWFVQVRA